MASLLTLKNFLTLRSPNTDSVVSMLYYRLTVAVLLCFFVLTTTSQFFGNPIKCISQDDVPEEFLDTYCWLQTTFSVDTAWNLRVGQQVPYPGVHRTDDPSTIVHHAYYQWVCFVLLLQAGMFYVPHWIWSTVEAGKIQYLTIGLESAVIPEDERRTRRKLLIGYFMRHLHCHKMYLATFILSQGLNFINVVGQMLILNRLLNGHFTEYGFQVVRFLQRDWKNRTDPMVRIFPRMTRCTFYRYGSGGGVQSSESMCLLPLNNINEKVYVLLWFLFAFLALASVVSLAGWTVLLVVPKFRLAVLRYKGHLSVGKRVEKMVRACSVGDWFLLYQLSSNMDVVNFHSFMEELESEVEEDLNVTITKNS
ncbi:innexin shaking-B-like [Ornithodoros turicata]|uniref:innexin shaking-B-like n=1 Tax=Ornithodoros turicata TaxID=34597 RepID=UPI003139C5A3